MEDLERFIIKLGYAAQQGTKVKDEWRSNLRGPLIKFRHEKSICQSHPKCNFASVLGMWAKVDKRQWLQMTVLEYLDL